MATNLEKLADLFGIQDVRQLPAEAADYLSEWVSTKLENEKADRKEFAEKLTTMSDEELRETYVPDVYQKDIYSIDYAKLWANGIRLISFDIDDTIADSFLNKTKAAVPGMKVTMPDEAKKLVRELHNMGFTVTLLTNARETVAKDTCNELHADGYIFRAQKPDTKNFEKMLETYRMTKEQMAHVGNSMRQDIVGGNRAGVTTCLVRRAGVSMKAVKKGLTLMGLQTKGHLVREELKKRKIWYKHHRYDKGDQYYQLDELPGYLK